MSALKPNLTQKPKLPPKPRLQSPRQSHAVHSPAVVDRVISRIEPGTVRQRALSFSNREEVGGSSLLLNARKSAVSKAGFQSSALTKTQTITPSRENKQRDHKKEGSGWKKNLTSDGGQVGRSDPDGSEMEELTSGVKQCELGSLAPHDTPEEKHCHCICHLHRPGMKLVWVPLQTDEKSDAACMEKEEIISQVNEGQTIKPSGESETQQGPPLLPRLTNTHITNTRPALPPKHTATQKSPTLPQCINCQSFRLHHGSQKDADAESIYESIDVFFRRQSSSKNTPPKLSASPKAQNQSNQPLKGEEPEYLEILPSLEGTNTTSTPPIPPPRPLSTLQGQKKDRRATQPVLAYMLSPRGGRPPIRSQSSYEKRSGDLQSGKTKSSDKDKKTSVGKDEEQKESSKNNVRKISSDWEPNSDYEPLYQVYQEKVSKDAAQLECHRKSMSECLGLNSSSTCRRDMEEITLWQKLPVVEESGVLLTLSHTEIQRQECMFEVLTSEASYLRSLRVLKDHFLGSRELDDTLVIHDKKSLFSNIMQVYEVSERFMQDLLNRVDENVVISDVCDIIHHHAENYFSVYTDYVRNQVYQEKTYSRLMQCNRAFATVMRRLEESPLCRRLPFTSFMLLPFQRITRIKILIQSILKRTDEGSVEEDTASKALTIVSEIIKEANTQVGQMKQMEDLMHVANVLEFDKLKAIPLVSKTRCLEKQGELQELSKGGSLFGLRFRFTPVYIFLFNDLFILTARKSVSPERFVVLDHTHRSLVHLQPIEGGAGSQIDHAFCLTLLENHQGNTCERLLKANTESDMHRWMAAFPSLNVTQEVKAEKVYEDWDCPQVQCICQYIAKQADELSLEPSDIINVIRKTNEGWCEGIRLSDRQRGWFPQEAVTEVTNEHQRRRNLREQYRIAQATNHKHEVY